MRLKLSSDKEKETRTKPTKARPKRIRRPRTRRSITFLVALAISSLLWLVTALNNPSNRMVELAIPVKYENLTGEYAFEKEPPHEIHVQLEASGFNLLRYSFFPHGDTIRHFVTKDDIHNRRFEVSESLMMQRVQQSIGTNSIIRWISPSNISIPFYRRSSKKVPIRQHLYTDVRSGFLLRSILMDPSVVEIFGTHAVLDTIKQIETEKITLKDLHQSQEVRIALIAPDGVTLKQDSVWAKVEVEELTQQSFEVPLKVINLPGGVHLRPLPATVEVQIVIPSTVYNRYKAEDFMPFVDYNDVSHSADTTASPLLDVEMEKVPDLVDRYKITPARVQYIIEKN